MKVIMALVLGLSQASANVGGAIDEARLKAALENIHARTTSGPTAAYDANWSNLVGFAVEVLFGLALARGGPTLKSIRGRNGFSPRATAAALGAVVGVTGGLVLLSHGLAARRNAHMREALRGGTSPEVLAHYFNLTVPEQFEIGRRDPELARVVVDISDAYHLIDQHRGTTTYSSAR